MFLFIVAVALVVIASLIFVFTKDWDEDADYPDEALQEEKTVHRKKRSVSKQPTPVPETDLPEKDWIEAIITEPEEQIIGKHEAEAKPIKQFPQEATPLIPLQEEKTKEIPKTTFVEESTPKKIKENYGSLKPFPSEDEAPKGKEPSLLILVLEIICGFAILLAIITTIIAWRVYTVRTGGY